MSRIKAGVGVSLRVPYFDKIFYFVYENINFLVFKNKHMFGAV